VDCYRLRGPGVAGAHAETCQVHAPGPGEIRVKMLAASLNYRDLAIMDRFDENRDVPLIPLSDGVGEIVELGDGIRRFALGDRIAGCFYPDWIYGKMNRIQGSRSLGGGVTDGVLCTERIFNEEAVVAIPACLSPIEAATLPCAALTAWNALQDVRAGDTIVTQGTGGVAIFALQFAKAAGARVVALSSSAEKMAKLLELGADDVINYHEQPRWADAVLQLTGGRGADHIVEVGGASSLPNSLQAIAWNGEISLIGTLGHGQINPTPIMVNSAIVRGIRVGSREMFEAMNRRIDAIGLHPVIDSVMAFSNAPDALRLLQSKQHFGKIVIQIH